MSAGACEFVPDGLRTYSAIPGQYRSISPPIKPHTERAFCAPNQIFCFLGRHCRQIEDVLAALAAKSHSIASVHPLPFGIAWRSYSDPSQWRVVH